MNTMGATPLASSTLAKVLLLGHLDPGGFSLGFTHANRAITQEMRADKCETGREPSASTDATTFTETAAR